MSYGVSGSGSLLPDLPDDPEVILTDFLKANWNDGISGVPLAEIDWGFEPDAGNTMQYIIKVEENNEDAFSPDLVDKYTQTEFYMNIHVWHRDGAIFQTTPNMARWKMRRFIKRLIKQNCRDGISISGNRYIKHLYYLGGGNTPEPERKDWHHSIIVCKMVTWIVSTT